MHWSDGIAQSPEDAGFWSVTKAEDVLTVSRDWQTYSSAHEHPAHRPRRPARTGSSGCSSGWTRPSTTGIKALFQRGVHPEGDRRSTRTRSARSPTGVLDGLDGRETCDLVTDVAQPVVARVIGSFMGLDPAGRQAVGRRDQPLLGFGDPDLNPKGLEQIVAEDLPAMYEKCMRLVADRRANPDRGHAQRARLRRDRRRHAHRRRDLLRVRPAHGRRQRLDEGDVHEHDARADGEPRPAAAADRRPVARARRRRGGAADVPGVRALPPHRDEGHRASAAARSRRATRSRSGTRRPTATRTATRTPTASTSGATPSTRPSAPAAVTSAWAPRSRASS